MEPVNAGVRDDESGRVGCPSGGDDGSFTTHAPGEAPASAGALLSLESSIERISLRTGVGPNLITKVLDAWHDEVRMALRH